MPGEVKLLPTTVPLVIYAEDDRLLFRVNADGTADGEVADASEAARVFAEHVAPYFTRPTTVVSGQLLPEAEIAALAERCAVACRRAPFPSTATFETRIEEVLRASLIKEGGR